VALERDDIERLYRLHAQVMVGFFARRTYDPEAAVDLVAETFAAALSSRRRFRGRSDEDAVGWLYGIARHQLSGWYRRGRVQRRAMQRLGVQRRELSDPELERIEELADLAALREQVAAGVDALPADQRVVVRLRVVDERSYAEIAQELQITETAARARLSRGMRALASLGADADQAEVRRA